MRWLACAICLVACGDDSKVRHLPDAPPPPPVDGTTIDPVSLAIFEGTMPRAGVRVIFQAADSSVVLDTMTDADGKAAATMEAGGFVTAIGAFEGRGSATVQTFAGVKPGDALRLFEPPLAPETITLTFTLPNEPAAETYRVVTNCFEGSFGPDPAGGNPTGSFAMPSCGGTSNLLAIALDVVNQPISSIFQPSVTLVDGSTLDLSGETFTAVPDSTFTYSNLPVNATAVGVFGVRATTLGTIYSFSTSTEAGGGEAMMTMKIPTIADGTASTLSTIYGAQYTQHIIGEWGPITSAYTLDPTGLLLPEFSAGATLDIAAHAIEWSASGGAVQPDFAHVRALLNRGGQSWTWEIVTPSGSQAVLPVLPDGSRFNPQTGDFGSYLVTTAKVPGGYDAVREGVLAADNLQAIAVGAAGKASFAILVEPEAFTTLAR